MPDYLTANELRRLYPNISQDCLARSAVGPVAGLPDPKREQNQRREGQDREPQACAESIRYRITIISIRSRLVDAHDNFRTGAKSLVDIITRSLGFDDDANPRLEWHYEQFVGKPASTIVLIQRCL